LRLHVKLTPRAEADRIEGWSRDPEGRSVLAVRVRARPVEGEANAALETLLAKALGVRRSAVQVVRGGQSRVKAVEIEGAGAADLERAFGAPNPVGPDGPDAASRPPRGPTGLLRPPPSRF
jgi:uncharacterized protein YggU (UPF0235/DUF167 family)